MEDKIFELISNMYSDIKGQFGKINERLTTIETKIDSKADKTDIVTLEDKIDSKIEALFDGYKQVYEKLVVLEEKLDNVESKVHTQDVEIRVIKSVK